ncbi:MAG: hypothetical protein U9Q83_07315, partial [Bacteroidota bacterium]|nr:hypothetical protein [Bacteroidota bacterium]
TNPEHKKKVNKIININKLLVSTVKSNEYKAILKLQSKNLSSPDCSILYHKKKTNGILLTGDGSLRKTAIKHNIAVKGIFLIFDELVKSNTIDKQTAFEKLKLLQSINKRLPQNEIKNRLNLWEKGQTNQ